MPCVQSIAVKCHRSRNGTVQGETTPLRERKKAALCPGHCQLFLLRVKKKVLRVMLNSSGVSLLAPQDKAAEHCSLCGGSTQPGEQPR